MVIDFVKSVWNEFMSYFVPEKVQYKVSGECKKCGKCCNYMYSFDTYTEKEFKIMQFLYPAYKRFYIKGKDECGNFVFACKHVTPDGLCSVYDKRLAMCKKYPSKYIMYPAKMHEGCGFSVEKKDFAKYLNKN
jgi:Fe-S-cluster containining protein